MQGATETPETKSRPYTAQVARKPRASKGPRPAQGARLLKFRKAAGLTQTELADFLKVSHANIAFWEWSEKPPRSDLLPLYAKALGVELSDLIIGAKLPAKSKTSGPVGEIQKTFEQVKQLPRSQQRKVLEMVQALVEQYKRKAS